MPAPDLYPHQWLWDSCFISIGLRHVNVERAMEEILSLLQGQWSNGMIPHMVFDPHPKYQNDRKIWSSQVSAFSPDTVATSGITQPPLLAQACVKIGESLSKQSRIQFYKKVLPAIIDYHEWLMTDRDPHKEGLVLQIHPWETGLDNTPPWMVQLHEHSKPWWIQAVEKLRIDAIVHFIRRDTRHVPPGQRISNVEALMVFDIIKRFKRKAYNIDKILHRSLFCIEDVAFNSILARNNTLVMKMAEVARFKLPEYFLTLVKTQAEALERCWDENNGMYFSRDFISHDFIEIPTIAGLLPLYSGVISKERAERLVSLLKERKSFGLRHPVPSVPLNSEYFQEERYWQGPTWINTNWLLVDGLQRYGYEEEANHIIRESIHLVENGGAHEYFSSLKGTPLGANNFSWTAALTLDFIRSLETS